MKNIFILLSLLLIFVLSCSKTVFVSDNTRIIDGEYDSEFPHIPTTGYLEEITQYVKLVNAMAGYKGYDLPLKNGLIRSELNGDLVRQKAIREKFLNSPATGTATVIFHDQQKVALLTCAHIVNYPDTIVTFYLDRYGKKTPFVQSVYYKVRQTLTVTGLPEVNDYEVLASDEDTDIAIIGKKYSKLQHVNIREFNYPKGAANDLKAGTFVYLFGFPRGERMVSTAIVGRANKDRNNGFILDASMHNGISGGLVLAVRDGIPNFEMVGMVFAVAGQKINFLGPDEETEPIELDMQRPYDGQIYLNSTRQVVYGLTYAVSIEAIEDFIEENSGRFEEKGFESPLFLNTEKPASTE
ncbi:MAG: serine protease [Calditrichaeota bacterium]|nr:MAG: serine protease [Calditrichota bacterium]MBL1204889.1 serine protease [Calditrichota bacterium]NOG44718.1 trypsin-like peptidase domain-containing protein [Calditrichota bacterium]